jgi:hypothetical protein
MKLRLGSGSRSLNTSSIISFPSSFFIQHDVSLRLSKVHPRINETMGASQLPLLALLLAVAASHCHCLSSEFNTNTKAGSTEAYATLVYGDDFVLGARVLGQSLRESGTTRYITVFFRLYV